MPSSSDKLSAAALQTDGITEPEQGITGIDHPFFRKFVFFLVQDSLGGKPSRCRISNFSGIVFRLLISMIARSIFF